MLAYIYRFGDFALLCGWRSMIRFVVTARWCHISGVALRLNLTALCREFRQVPNIASSAFEFSVHRCSCSIIMQRLWMLPSVTWLARISVSRQAGALTMACCCVVRLYMLMVSAAICLRTFDRISNNFLPRAACAVVWQIDALRNVCMLNLMWMYYSRLRSRNA